ncbi:MAG TPA: heme-binding domain-containing protein [Acidimicrobiia bacterium]|nr:heme-binding domain-containing protein [Acidimicrobiia bacterium]
MSLNRILVGLLALGGVFALGFVLGSARSTWERGSWRANLWRLGKPLLIVTGVFVLAIQFIPYGRAHANPPVQAEPVWSSSETRELTVRACFDCHSNETEWPWYSNIAPVSWLVQRDVDQGRAKANWSEWASDPDDESSESAETVIDGSMPPGLFTILHPEARLTDAEVDALVAGLESTFGSSGDGEDD